MLRLRFSPLSSRSFGRILAIAILASALSACSVSTSVIPSHHSSSTVTPATEVPASYGVLQLRPLVQPPGARLPTCPVGEYLGTCTNQLDFSSWYGPVSKCPRTTSSTNPPPYRPVKMIDSLGSNPVCVSLASASFAITSAESVNTEVQPLNGQPGIEITLPPSQEADFDAAMEKSFRKPVAAVADGQIVYMMTIEPNGAEYMPMGSMLVAYASSTEIQRVVNELNETRSAQ